jgi:transcription elongation factor
MNNPKSPLTVLDTSNRNEVQIGDTFRWQTVSGESYEGIIKELDSNVAVVELHDGTLKSVEL